MRSLPTIKKNWIDKLQFGGESPLTISCLMDLARRKSRKTARPVARQGRLPSCLTYCFPKDELNPCGPALYESDSFRSAYGIR